MIKLRKSSERGHADLGWLDSYHSFSFGDYYDPAHMGYRSLRVINDDLIGAGGGFGMHPHRDMEIISYVVEGELEHKDSMGNGSIIKPGNVQKMSAGTGVMHSEFNPSSKSTTRLIQIWIVPDKKGLKPSYQEIEVKSQMGLTLVASNQAKGGDVHISQDVRVYRGYFEEAQELDYALVDHRGVWIQMVNGDLKVEGHKLQKGDGMSIENQPQIHIKAISPAEFLLFDLGPT